MARVARRSGRVSVRSRKFIWARRTVNQVAAAAGPTWINVLDQFETELGAQVLGVTVMRIRGTLWFEPAAASDAHMAAGFLVDADENISDGVDEGPFDEPHKNWMAYEPVLFSSADTQYQVHRWDIDVKSNRKMEELGQGFAFVFDNQLAATTVQIRGVVSVGLKLP